MPRRGRPVSSLVLGAAALGAGLFSALQSRANGTLGTLLGDSLAAALWSFGSGWAILSLVTLFRPSVRTGLRTVYRAYRNEHLRWWQFLGGLLGGCYVGTQAYVVPLAGVALFSVASLAGQTVNALLVDRLGLGPGGVRPVSRLRLGAAALALCGIVVAVSGRAPTGGLTTRVLLPVGLAFVTGAGLSLQAAINGRVRQHSRDVVASTWINFTWGTALLGSLLVGRAAVGEVSWAVPQWLPWWSLAGGVLGVTNVAAATVLVHRLGVLVLMLLGLAGQLVGALILDLVMPQTRALVGPALVVGLLITLFAAGAAGIAARRAGSPADPVAG
ncbi:MAG TPA: DMT family transporter [Dermatophilaceae bacterium]|nr:DMT family transporter [Dermatophilaceae bacterium]